MDGELTKLTIEAFRDPSFAGEPVDSFELMFNPENYSNKYEVEYNDRQGAGDTASPQVYERIKPRNLSFEFMLDGTGTSGPKVEVQDEIEHLLDLTVRNDGEIHRPFYVIVTWGTLLLKGVVKSVDISYTLFKPDGSPLRAKVKVTVAEAIQDEERVAEADNSSPDLTHRRIVKGGDKLPLMVDRIYGDPAYYFQVARANNLNNFRRLEEGQELIFPPVKNKQA